MNTSYSKDELLDLEIIIEYTSNVDSVQNIEEINSKINLKNYLSTAYIQIPKSKIVNTFLEKEIEKNKNKKPRFISKDDPNTKENNNNILTIILESKDDSITIDILLECLEYLLNPSNPISYNKQNLIGYLKAFTLCEIDSKRDEVIQKLENELTDENLILFIQSICSIKDTRYYDYIYYLIKQIINRKNNYPNIEYTTFKYKDILRSINYSNYSFASDKILNNKNQFESLAFLKETHDKITSSKQKFFTVNNYFNMGKVYKVVNNDGLLTDYPHIFNMKLDNDTDVNIYAMRESENSNFVISTSVSDFSRFGPNYLGEIECNFWGTFFSVYDNGYNEKMYDSLPQLICNKRKKIGDIHYETNIMGECPRFFQIDSYNTDEKIHMENVKPEWSNKLQCYCLNFYGRVKKASAKNFQIIDPEDEDNILLQHGKFENKVYNIDFREPFSPVFAFAVSLAALGSKRVVT